MQCVDIALDDGIMTMVNAGHPYPVLYSTGYARCDRLAVRGPLLHSRPIDTLDAGAFRARHAEIFDGSIVVLITDGITEGGPIKDPYGYRFTSVVESSAGAGAKAVCDAIVNDWRSHQGDDPATDDATILVLVVNDEPRSLTNAH